MEAVVKQNTGVSAQVDRKPILTGIITGQIAGLIMAVVVMIVFAVFLGKSPLYPVQVIGSMVFGESALPHFHFGALIAGLLLHQFGPSLLWGFLFGVVARQISIKSTAQALVCGMVIGVVSMVGPYALIPFLMNTLQGVDIWNREVPMFWDWAAHIVFGASFVLYPKIADKLITK